MSRFIIATTNPNHQADALIKFFGDILDQGLTTEAMADAAGEEARLLSDTFAFFSRVLGELQSKRRFNVNLSSETIGLIFQDVASQSGILMRSPFNIITEKAYAEIANVRFGDIVLRSTGDGETTHFLDMGYRMGFIFIDSEGEYGVPNRQVIELPLLIIDNKPLEIIDGIHETPELLMLIAQAADLGNHDVLHALAAEVARPVNRRGHIDPLDRKGLLKSQFMEAHYAHTTSVITADTAPWYEAGMVIMWSALTQKRLADDAEFKTETEKMIDDFVEKISSVASQICSRSASLDNQRNAYLAYNYFANLFLYGLARVLPLDHPVMVDAMDKIHAADAYSFMAGEMWARDLITYNRTLTTSYSDDADDPTSVISLAQLLYNDRYPLSESTIVRRTMDELASKGLFQEADPKILQLFEKNDLDGLIQRIAERDRGNIFSHYRSQLFRAMLKDALSILESPARENEHQAIREFLTKLSIHEKISFLPVDAEVTLANIHLELPPSKLSTVIDLLKIAPKITREVIEGTKGIPGKNAELWKEWETAFNALFRALQRGTPGAHEELRAKL